MSIFSRWKPAETPDSGRVTMDALRQGLALMQRTDATPLARRIEWFHHPSCPAVTAQDRLQCRCTPVPLEIP